METTEPVSMDETMESPAGQNDALGSTSPDDGGLKQAEGVPSQALPVGSRAESAIVDGMSSSAYAEDWLKIAQTIQEKMFGGVGFSDGMADNVDTALVGAAGPKGLQEQIIDAAMPEVLDVSGYVCDLAASMDTALAGAAGLKGLQDQIMGAAMPEALDVSGYVYDLAASLDTALVGTAGLKGLQDQIIGAAMPEALDVSGYVRDLATGVNMTVAWADILQVQRKELFRIDDRLMRHVRPMLESSKAVSNLYLNDDERFAKCCMRLGRRGWFLDPQMPMSLLWYLADTFGESPEEADELLMQWFQERLDEIEEDLVKICPRRARVLRSAFNAHRQRDYNNSVPAILKEADGMWHDLFGMNVFIARARKSIVKSIKQKQPYGLVCTSLVPLLQSSLPLWMNESERHIWMKKHRTDSFPGLNRHVVVHGISVDYGTEKNSLKAISFLNWRLLVELVVREP